MLPMQKLWLPLLLTLSLGLSACAEDEEISLPPPKAQSSEPATPTEVTPPTASESASDMEELEEHDTFKAKTGFPTDCEAYIKDMGQCIDKLNETNQDAANSFQETLNHSVEDWKAMDYDAATNACRQATEFWQKSKADIGC